MEFLRLVVARAQLVTQTYSSFKTNVYHIYEVSFLDSVTETSAI